MIETKGGQYGDQTGAKFWQLICREHGYDPTVRDDERTVKMRKVTKSDIEMEEKSKQER
ncbi:unnamed protein product [Brassica oleracea var. botrytis]